MNIHLYCASYNSCKERWCITSNGDNGNDDNEDDNGNNNKKIDKIIVIIAVRLLVIGPFEKPRLQATFESVQ